MRPTRLPAPLASVKRYQYTVAGDSPPISARHVQSAASLTDARAFPITRRNSASCATSTVSVRLSSWLKGRRVHSTTLCSSGSPEATPCGKHPRSSLHAIREGAAEDGVAHTPMIPREAAPDKNCRRSIFRSDEEIRFI